MTVDGENSEERGRETAIRDIRACIARHNVGRDNRDPVLLTSVYHTDAIVSFGPPITAQAWIERICTSPAALTSYHRTAEPVIRVEGAVARSEVSCIAHVLLPEQGAQRFLFGRYLDQHADRGNGWRIIRRWFVHDLTMELPLGASPLATRLLGPEREHDMAPAARSSCEISAVHLISAAALAADRGDEARLRAMAAPGVVLAAASPDRRSFHMAEHARVHPGTDGPTVTCRMLTIHAASKPGARDRVVTATQTDRLVPCDKSWMIGARHLDHVWSGASTATQVALPFEPGRADRDDPSYAFLR